MIHNTTIENKDYILERCLQTCTEMLQDRGCTHIERHPNLTECIESGEPCLRGRGLNKINVIFHNEDRVGVKIVRQLKENSNVDTNIIVSTEGPTTFTRKEIEDGTIQFFTFREVSLNITKHAIVPKHELVRETLPWSLSELPKIVYTDPIVMYYNFPIGSVVKITRILGAHEPQIYYRVVVANI